MRRPSLDLSDASRNLEESIGSPTVASPDPMVDLSMPPPLEDIRDEEEVHRISAPPPHIAARFYRPTQTRRKGLGRLLSPRFYLVDALAPVARIRRRDGPPEQICRPAPPARFHPRDRKARLADRAAHAEKVRLRAALAKAARETPR